MSVVDFVDVSASVVHAVAQVEVTQVYVNEEQQPIEAVYWFPVNPDGAVTHFQAELGGRTIRGVVKPKEEAKGIYYEALKDKKTVGLGEETKPDMFNVRVGFLKPGRQVKVIIGYVTEVKNEPGTNTLRFYVPTTIAPRRVSLRNTDNQTTDMEFLNESPAPLSLRVSVSMQGEIKSIASPTHSVTVDKMQSENEFWHKAIVQLNGRATDMDRDFVLAIEPTEKHKPRLYSEKNGDGSTAVMIQMLPSFQLKDQKTELIFVLDRSGSMEGAKISLARRALLLFLHSMPSDCYFNVMGFGSTVHFLFPMSKKYNRKHLKKAKVVAKGLKADLGETNIFRAFKDLYERPKVDGYLRQIFVLTDGEVFDTESVFGIVKVNAHNARVFAIGIGDGASHYLVEGIAKVGDGTSAFVTNNESIETKLLNQLKNALQPALTGVELEWEGLSSVVNNSKRLVENEERPRLSSLEEVMSPYYHQSPRIIPPVYSGSQLLVFGLFRGECPKSVLIKAKSPDGLITFTVEHFHSSEMGDIGGTLILHRLAAIRLVRELEFEVSALYLRELTDVAKEEKILTKEIEEIACENGVTSRYTSFVAVDVEEDTPLIDSWVLETRKVPSQITKRWQSAYLGTKHRRQWLFDRDPKLMLIASTNSVQWIVTTPMESEPTWCSSIIDRISQLAACCGRAETDEDNASPLFQLISLQSFDGSFGLTKNLATILEKPLKEMKDASIKGNCSGPVFATALAISFFTTKLPSERETWDLVVMKARTWLNTATQPESSETVIAKASDFLEVSLTSSNDEKKMSLSEGYEENYWIQWKVEEIGMTST